MAVEREMGMMGLLAVAVATIVAVLFGGGLLQSAPHRDARHLGQSLPFETTLALLAGLTSLAAILLLWSALPFRWGRGALALVLLAMGAWGWWRGRWRRDSSGESLRWGWGDAITALALLVYAGCTFDLWNVHPDFIYHWGIKAQKYQLAGGLDFDYLAAPGSAHVHPDYPHLLPVTYAAMSMLAGAFDERALLLWSVVLFAAAWAAARELLGRCDVGCFSAQAALASLGLMLTMFGVGYLQAGGADWLMAVAVIVGAALLVGPADRKADFGVGVVAAFAAATKLEGLPLAAFLVGIHLVRRRAPSPRELPAAALRSALPAVVMVALWLPGVWQRGLFQASNTEGFDLSRAGVVADALWNSLLTVNWHFLSFLLLLLPLLLVSRRLRPVAALCLLQLAFYVYVYMAGPGDTSYWVETSAARLFFHLMPATLVALVAGLDGWASRRSFPAPS